MAKKKIENKGIAALVVLLMLALVLAWTINDLRSIYNLFRLHFRGRETSAQVTYTRTRFLDAWPYRVEYRFNLNGQVYEEPVHNSYRMRDVGAPLPKAAWGQAKEADALSITYLPEDPTVNMPAEWGAWLVPLYWHKVWAFLMKATLVFILLLAIADVLGASKLAFSRKALGPWAGLFPIAFLGWLFIEVLLRLVHFFASIGEMGALDIIISVPVILASAALPVGITAVIMKYKLTKGWKKRKKKKRDGYHQD